MAKKRFRDFFIEWDTSYLWFQISVAIGFIVLPIFFSWIGYELGGVKGLIFGIFIGFIIGWFSAFVLIELPWLLVIIISVVSGLLKPKVWIQLPKACWEGFWEGLNFGLLKKKFIMAWNKAWPIILVITLLWGVKYFWGIEIQWDEIFKLFGAHEK